MGRTKLTHPTKTVVAGGSTTEQAGNSDLDDDATSEPKGRSALTPPMTTAPKAQAMDPAPHYAHRPIRRGTMHRSRR